MPGRIKYTDYNPDGNHIRTDTLYIFGEYGSAYKMSYHPQYGYDIVKNDNNKLIATGQVVTSGPADTTILDKPFIWTFFNMDTGAVDKSILTGYYCSADSVHIAIEKHMEFINKLYDVYVIRYFTKNSRQWNEQVISADGLMRHRYFYGDELKSERIILSKHENYLPAMQD